MPQSIPLTVPPSFSCRSGLSVLLAGNGPRGPYTLPFQFTSMTRRLCQEEPFHVMVLKQRTLEEV